MDRGYTQSPLCVMRAYGIGIVAGTGFLEGLEMCCSRSTGVVYDFRHGVIYGSFPRIQNTNLSKGSGSNLLFCCWDKTF